MSPVPATLRATLLKGRTSFLINASGLTIGQSYSLQSTSNLAAAVWFTETSLVANQTVAAITNSMVNAAQKFYRVLTY